MKLTNLQACEQALLAFVPPPRSQRQKYSLRHIRAFMQAIGNPQNTYQVVHVAGTSGKTSTCYYLAALFKEAGLKVGLTVSPHITKVTERVQIQLEPLSDAHFASELTEFLTLVKKVGIELTYFEVLIAFAYWSFARQSVDVAVIETGLGGLLDGSNIVHNPSKVCVLADIGIDHTAVLGNTLAEIAAQKAGIIGEGNEVFCWQQSAPVMAVFKNAARMQHAALHTVQKEYPTLPAKMPLYQKRNFSLAFEASHWTLQNIFNKTLTNAQVKTATLQAIPARMEQMMIGGIRVTLDGAHNPQKMAAFVASYQRLHKKPPIIVCAIMEGPDSKIDQTVAELLNLTPKKVIVTSFQSLQDLKKLSVAPEQLAHHFRRAGYENTTVCGDPKDALKQALKEGTDVVVTGSLYLLFEIRDELVAQR